MSEYGNKSPIQYIQNKPDGLRYRILFGIGKALWIKAFGAVLCSGKDGAMSIVVQIRTRFAWPNLSVNSSE